jgi:predicted nucleotidyltransferase
MGNVINARRIHSNSKFQELQKSLVDAPGICENKACVYATGSFGRGEASIHSDIDLFIVSLCDGQGKEERSRLTKLNEIL